MLNNVIKIPQTIKKSNNDDRTKEVRKVNNIIRFSQIAKKSVLRGSSVFLGAVAVFFASAACVGHFYEPEVPEKIK